jgi:serine/threonine-protein kinase RsbW
MMTDTLTLTSAPGAVTAAEDAVMCAMRELGYDETSIFAVRLAVQEAMTNAITHGNAGDPRKSVRFHYEAARDRIVIEIEDEGGGFDPSSVPDPTREENLRIPAGRGIALMRGFMTAVDFQPPGNTVRMVYERPSA